MFLFSHLKVTGHSMEPTFISGQSIFVSILPYLFSNPKKEDIVVFRFGDKLVVKRVTEVRGKKFGVGGDNKKDSKDFGTLKRSEILGKIIYFFE